MPLHGRSAKTGVLIGKGKRAEAYSFSKKYQIVPDPHKLIQKYIKFTINFLWNCFYFFKENVLKMISIDKSPKTTNNSKQNKEKKIKTNLSRKNAGNNWETAAQQIIVNSGDKKSPEKKGPKKINNSNVIKYIAIDCEMVGVGPEGQDDMLARVSLVNQKGEVLLDKYVKPKEPVTDYRTEVSGIRPHNIENAEEFNKVQDEVLNIIQGNTLVGHSIKKDLTVLYLNHPIKYIRDTAKYRPLAKLVSNGATPSLKRLSKSILGIDIQEGEHDSVEDAKATMAIYNRVSADWEKYIRKKEQRHKGQSHSHHHKHGHGHGRKT